jgi:thymidine kinase
VVSHNQNKIRSTAVENPNEILLLGSNCDVVGIDEAQFFDESIVDIANQLANNGIRVVIAGLDMDYLGRPFGPMPNLMATAEYVTKVHAICRRTGNLAHYSMRTSAGKDLVQLGETDSYDAVSRKVFVEEVLNKK